MAASFASFLASNLYPIPGCTFSSLMIKLSFQFPNLFLLQRRLIVSCDCEIDDKKNSDHKTRLTVSSLFYWLSDPHNECISLYQ